MKKYIKIHSHAVGVGVGFLNFYVLYYLWEISWAISFVIAFSLGYLASCGLDIYAGKMTDADIEKTMKLGKYQMMLTILKVNLRNNFGKTS